MEYQGGCLCGQVRFETEAEPVNVQVCHCRICQRAFAAAFNARALYEQSKVRTSGETVQFASSERLWRVSCAKCNTRVWTARKDGSYYGIPLANFDDQQAFKPTLHFWTSAKAPWVSIDDGLPQFEEWPPPLSRA